MVTPSTTDIPRLGELLVKKHAITEQQLTCAVSEQKKHPETPLGEILVKQKYINKRQLKRTLRWQKHLRAATMAMAFSVTPTLSAFANQVYPQDQNVLLLSQWASKEHSDIIQESKNKKIGTSKSDKKTKQVNTDTLHSHYYNHPHPSQTLEKTFRQESTEFQSMPNLFSNDKKNTLSNEALRHHLDVLPDGMSVQMRWHF